MRPEASPTGKANCNPSTRLGTNDSSTFSTAGNSSELDKWSNSFIAEEGGNSAHEIRTWVAAFAALASAGPYQTGLRYYKPAAELIAGFAVRTAVST